MKVKYYMRGIGIGIILTILITSLGNKSMTEEEIKQAARELGMVEQTTTSGINLEELKNEQNQEEETESSSEDLTVTPEPAKDTEPTVTTEPTTTPEQTVTAEPTVTPESAATPTPEPTKIPEKESTSSGNTGIIEVDIKQGMYSEAVSKKMEEAGLVEDWSVFNKYLIDHGYASKIRYKLYKIPAGASFYEIAELITSKPY